MTNIITRYISGGEIKDVSIAAYCLGLIENDKGIFMTKEDTKKVDEIANKIRQTIAKYAKKKKNIMHNIEKLSNIIAFTLADYDVQYTLLALNLLFSCLHWTERKGKMLNEELYSLWSSIEADTMYLMNKYNDNYNEDLLVSNWNFAWSILERY